MKKTHLLVISILMVIVGLIIGYFGYTTPGNLWDGLSCEEMIDFTMSPEHQELTMEQHMEFHKDYEPCL